MLKVNACMFVAIAVIFSLSACGTKPVAEDVAVQPAAEPKDVTVKQAVAIDASKYLRVAAQADDMGHVYAVAVNTSTVTVANVYVMVVHFDATTRQPDNQSIPLLVAKKMAPGERAQIELPGIQVYKQSELEQYRVIPVKAELAE